MIYEKRRRKRMRRNKLIPRIVGMAALAAMLTTSVMPGEILAAENAEAKSETVEGSVPEAETEEVPEATGIVYYVDSEGGNDSNDGKSKETAFRTLDKVNEMELQPGDGISLKCGSVFQDQKLAPKGSGTEEKPIVINTYVGDDGNESRPVIHAGGFRIVDGEYVGNKEAVLIENMEYVWVTGLEVTNDDDFDVNWRSPSRGEDVDLNYPRRLGIHVTIDSRAASYKTVAGNAESRAYKGIVIDNCYIHDVDGNEQRQVNKVDGGIGVEVISDSTEGLFPYFDGVTLQNNRIDHVDRTGIKLVRISDLKNFYYPDDLNCDVDHNGENDQSRYNNIRNHDQAARNVRVVNNYVSDVGGDGILICESTGAIVEHNILDGNAMRVASGNANAGIWSWNSFDTTFRYNESFHGPDYNQDGCSFDSDYWSAGTIFEYNYSHDVPMGFMLLMGGNDTDIIRYNLSQNDGVAWRHGAGGANSPSYIYNNVFYYDGANWLYNHSNNNGVAMGNSGNWEMYNNIYYNYNPDSVSRWSSKEGTEATEADWSNNKLGGNLVYEAGGVHSPGEIPGAIQAGGEDEIFLNPGGAEGDDVKKDEQNWSTNWESLKAYGLTEDSLARNAGVYVDVKPQATGNNVGHWDSEKDRNATTDFFGNELYDGAPDIGIIEMSNEDSEREYPLEANAAYTLRSAAGDQYISADAESVSMASEGSSFVVENAEDGYKIRIWDMEKSGYYYLTVDGNDIKMTDDDSAVWTATDLHNGLHMLSMDGKYLSCDEEGNLSAASDDGTAAMSASSEDDTAASWYLEKTAQSKSYNAGGGEIPGFSADRKYDEQKKLSGYTTDDMQVLTGDGEGVYATGVTAETIEYKLYADNEAHDLKLYVSEMGNIEGRTFDVIVNGEAVLERYTLSGETDVIELADIYPSEGVITVRLQSAYSEQANAMTDPILNGITADAKPMGEVNMRIDAGNTDTANMANHDGLYADAAFEQDGKSGYYEADGKETEQINSTLEGNKPVPDAGMGTALKSGRAGEDFGYKFKVSPGQYRIKLYFNDTSNDSFTADPFNVYVNDELVKENFDIVEAAGGQNKAVDITVTAEAKDGMIDIRFKAAEGEKAMVNAVVVEPYKELDSVNLVTPENVSADAREADSMAVQYAADNNQSTRWSSGTGANHWIQADLGKKYMVSSVMADWTPGAYATTYRVEVSNGDGNWTSVKRVTDAYPGLNLVEFDPVEAQQVRIIAETYNDQWGMSLTEFGVYGEEITGEAASTVSVTEQGSGVYNVEVGLEHIYQKYRNVMISFTYDPAKMTLQKEPAALNDAALLKTGEAAETDNEDGTKTVTFTYGIKDQAAFKEAAQAMTGLFVVNEGATRSAVNIDVSLTNAEGHVTTLEQTTAYVPNTFTYAELAELIEKAEDILYNAEIGTTAGTYPQTAWDTFKAAIDSAKEVGTGQEESVYENAYLALEAAIADFEASVNQAQYQSYHKDYAVDTEADYTYGGGASGEIRDGALVLNLPSNGSTGGTALDNQAPSLTDGVLRVRFATDSFDDQTLFRIGNIRVGYDKGGQNWFYDSARNGYGNFKYPATDPGVDQEHELLVQFSANNDNTYNVSMTLDEEILGSLSNLQYDVAPGQFQFETRRSAHNMSIYEVYFTNAPEHTITVSSGDNGDVSQEGPIAVYEETSKTFFLEPDEGYEVESVTVDGVKVAVTDNRVTVENPTEDMTLHVEFRAAGSADVDKTELQEEAELYNADEESIYTAETWAAYRNAYGNAQIVLNDSTATAEEVAEALKALQDAKAGLERKPVDKTGLEALLEVIKNLDPSEYTEESWNSLMILKGEAKTLLDNDEATRDQVADMLLRLQQGIADLDPVQATNPGTPTGPKPGGGSGSGTSSGDGGQGGTSGSDADKAVKTGDTAPIAGLIAIVICSGAAVLVIRRRRQA